MAFASQNYIVDGSVDKIVNWKDKYNALVNVIAGVADSNQTAINSNETIQAEIDNIGVYNDFLTAFNAAQT
jgi:hypothetical protein